MLVRNQKNQLFAHAKLMLRQKVIVIVFNIFVIKQLCKL